MEAEQALTQAAEALVAQLNGVLAASGHPHRFSLCRVGPDGVHGTPLRDPHGTGGPVFGSVNRTMPQVGQGQGYGFGWVTADGGGCHEHGSGAEAG